VIFIALADCSPERGFGARNLKDAILKTCIQVTGCAPFAHRHSPVEPADGALHAIVAILAKLLTCFPLALDNQVACLEGDLDVVL